MSITKRKVQRQQADLPVNLVLYNSLDDSPLSGPISSFLHDMSYYGAGLIVSKIFTQPHHLFYSPIDNEKHILCLEKASSDQESQIVIPVKPVWFRLGSGEVEGYFKMGVEFMTSPEDRDVINLEKLALANFEQKENLLTKLIRVFS